ncbi:hypothetical protein Micbo1qcDRAFT_191755 [Microdochium bolleyi]|uniref:DUF7907 domain-containing protein n=1 Tax=Microdochium bolleyi TaxID=196109 RepID=A0A136JJ91_9PEZI|nr:hypothetical protein Micbo1qcDRAFT_191755 [Microdochium bolleyi]
MRYATTLTALALTAAGIAAQDMEQSGPFYLHIKGYGNDLDGYVSACHAGAAIEGLCYTAGKPTNLASDPYEYYFNTTTSGGPDVDGSPTGTLFWRLPVQVNETTPFVEQAMSFQYAPSTNIAAPLFTFQSGTLVGFNTTGLSKQLFAYAYADDSKFQPGVRPDIGLSFAIRHWFVCWQYIGAGYYYQAVGFSTTLPPHNPTCQAVEIVRELPAN